MANLLRRLGRILAAGICFAFISLVLLLGMSCIHFGSPSPRTRVVAAHAQLAAFQSALGAYKGDLGRFPTQQQGLQSLRAQPAGAVNWQGPYLPQDIPMDPWGRAYEYTAPGESGCPPQLRSYGEDGQPGGIGLSADIVNPAAPCRSVRRSTGSRPVLPRSSPPAQAEQSTHQENGGAESADVAEDCRASRP